ncbi:hypothetical protein, partial [Thermosulfurimonas dismutans]|uniref:hypothetical protein n=1 Tax=Thermosulfurimonas dismutans TaxID=999894 RepID=UPI001ABF2C41
DTFWKEAENFKFNEKKYKKFERFLIFYSQLNGSLHKRINKHSYTGLKWYNVDNKEITNILQKVCKISNTT